MMISGPCYVTSTDDEESEVDERTLANDPNGRSIIRENAK